VNSGVATAIMLETPEELEDWKLGHKSYCQCIKID
jgi:hypothetical protein